MATEMITDYQDPPSLPSVTPCLWIITTNVIYYNILFPRTLENGPKSAPAERVPSFMGT